MRAPVLLGLLAVACQADGAPASLPHTSVAIQSDSGPIAFDCEIAATPNDRQKGLMFRKSLAPSDGMIFLFAGASHQTFWMHNTLIPLDMVFIRADKTVLGVVENAEPMTDTPRGVPGDSQFVLEINGGLAAQRGIRAGQHVILTATIPAR
jgi:uncharacterized membrane protein (UPF0127 family)